MNDNSKDILMHNLKNLSFSSSFDPISEKQEEMSFASFAENNQNKAKVSNKNSYMHSKDNSKENSKDNNNIIKNVLDDDIIKHCSTQKNRNSSGLNNKKKFCFNQVKEASSKNDEEQKISSINKSQRKKQKGKKNIQRNSVQESRIINTNLTLGQVNNSVKENYLKKNSFQKQGIHNSIINNKLLYTKENSYIKHYNNVKSLSNDANSEVNYINNIIKKKTILHKGKLDFSDKSKNNILEQIKSSDLYEKSENLLIKLKISYGILAVFSIICIILNFADVIIYNNKSLEYLLEQNNITYISENNIKTYYYINNRKISSKENNIRLFNGLFSLICTILLIIIYYIRKGNYENKSKNTKKERFKRMLNHYYNQQKKKSSSKKKLKQEKETIKNEKIKIINLDKDNKDLKNEASIRSDRNKTIILCIINIIFYPPFINKSFIGKYYNVVYVYSLNSIFLIISLFKIFNIYNSFFYLSSINNPFNIAICKSYLINLNSKFMFKYTLNKFPITFILFNIIIVLISMCITLCCIEFFSLNIRDDNFMNNYNENKREYFFNIFYSFLFFIIRNIYKAQCINSFLGRILFLFWGIIGILISSLSIYHMNNFIKFSVEEKDAYSKLSKLLKPINKEHKSSNLIKSLFLLKKIIRDNQNTEKDYKLKKEDINKHNRVQRKPILRRKNAKFLNTKIVSNNLNNLYDNKNEEKKKFIKYIEKKFVLKMKFIVEIRNFIDNLKVARNSSQSFNDVLKTVGNKMKANIDQLNNKLEILFQNDQKFSNFIKFTSKNIKHIAKINEYQSSILQYFVEIHNEYVRQMVGIKKETENNSIFYRNLSNVKRMKSNIFWFFNNKKKTQIKFANDVKQKTKKNKKDLYDLKNVNLSVKKQRSSMLSSLHLTNTNIEEKIKQARSKQTTNKSKKSRNIHKNKDNKRTKSLDDWKFLRNELKDKLKGRNKSTKKIERHFSMK